MTTQAVNSRTGRPQGLRRWLCGLLGLGALALAGCGLGGGTPSRPVSVVILLDTTSFAVKYWEDSLRVAQAVACELGPRDRLQLNAIDNSSGSDADVLLKDAGFPVVCPVGTIYAKQRAREAYEAIGGLARPLPTGNGTDLIGALRDAAEVFNRNSATPVGSHYPTYEPILLICSDLEPDGRDPEKALLQHPFSFPEGVRVRCLFVTKDLPETVRGKVTATGVLPDPTLDWQRLVTFWQGLFSQLGLPTTALDFRRVDESRVSTPSNAPLLRQLIREARYHD